MLIDSPANKGRKHSSIDILALSVGIILAGSGLIWPILVLVDVVSCRYVLDCVFVDATFWLGAFLSFSAYRALRKNNTRRIAAIRLAVLVITPFSILLGIFTGQIFFVALTKDRIVDAGKALLDFDGFLTVGWTIGFGLMSIWLRELRELRQRVVGLRRQGVQGTESLLGDVKQMSGSVFAEVAAAIVLFVISALFAVATILAEDGAFLLASLTFAVFGVIAMLLAWYDLFSKSEAVRYFLDTAP